NIFGANATLIHNIGYDNFIILRGGISLSENANVDLLSQSLVPGGRAGTKYSLRENFQTSFTPGYSKDVEEVRQVGATYLKGIHWGYYFYKIPLSLRRFAP